MREKILLVDDERDVLLVLNKALTSLGYRTFLAGDGHAALKQAQKLHPDLIILDIKMPEISGLEVCKKLKKDPKTSDIAIILFSAFDDVQSKVSGLEFGADDYLVKTSGLEEIKARVRSQLKLKKVRDELLESKNKLETATLKVIRELDVARNVQSGIYPKDIPRRKGLELAVHLVQARQVGGDYYDIIPISDYETALLVVDVSGHEIASAFIVGMAKISFSVRIQAKTSLVKIFDLVNQDMLAAIKTEHHLTAFLAVINTRDMTLRYAKAGHFNQYLFCAATGELELLSTEGMVIGAFEKGLFEEKQCPLNPGDKLILYTDGLIENRNIHGEQYSDSRLRDKILSGGNKSATQLYDLILSDHNDFCNGAPPYDDSCLMVAGIGDSPVSAKVKSVLDEEAASPRLFMLTDKDTSKKCIMELLHSLEEYDYSDALITHYRKTLHLLSSAFWQDPYSEKYSFHMVARINREGFKLVLVMEGKISGDVHFFTSVSCKNVLIHFNRGFGHIEITESGDRLVFTYSRKEEPEKKPGKDVRFQSKPDGVYITVPVSVSPQRTIESIREDMVSNHVINAEYTRIQKALTKRTGRPVKVGKPFRYYDIDKDKYFKMSATPMEARIFLSRQLPMGTDITREDLEFVLMREHICFGIDDKVLEEMAEYPVAGKVYVVARGKYAVDGRDAKILEKVNIVPSRTPIEKEGGKVDHKALDLISSVKKGAVILEKTPAGQGERGTSIFGRTMDPLPGKDIMLPSGENTEVIDNGTRLVAKVSGYLYKNSTGVHVREAFYVRGDVDYSTGNVDYSGDVFVAGKVLSGFKIKAGGNIWINGITEGAEVVSTDGSVEFNSGVLGRGKAKIYAKGNIKAEFIQEATLGCNGDLVVKKSLLHVNGRVTGNILLQDPKAGLIVGGGNVCRGNVEVARIGNEQGVKTEITLLSRKNSAVRESIEQAQEKKNEVENLLRSIKGQIHNRKKLLKTKPKKSSRQGNEIEKLLKAYYFCKQQISTIDEKLARLKKKSEMETSFGTVTASRAVYSNTVFKFDTTEKKVLSHYGASRVRLENDGISINPMGKIAESTERL